MVDAAEQNRRLEAIGSAAAGIAHDINNQLTLILNYLAMPDLEGARAAAGRCTALTASLLSYSRGESLALVPVDVASFVRNFAAGASLPEGVGLTLELPDSLPRIRADVGALTRVLTNLVSNACDAMKGVGHLRIVAAAGAIEVTDSGPGIDPRDFRHVFEPFFSTKGAHGTGLGLAIVRDIMRQHGGAVTVKSEPGSGACFSLRFRL